ncbi:uncharacterized protein LOC128298234 [Anopheles moucheti]|uniref:uncharacterized protein LOC128298234 n=1 Tax=Anopheles moucheti TaxID=186751 RepID=UPI0022F0A6D5|nr:uncharacterized protein LOC128298234 [Anopheles moucheti]
MILAQENQQAGLSRRAPIEAVPELPGSPGPVNPAEPLPVDPAEPEDASYLDDCDSLSDDHGSEGNTGRCFEQMSLVDGIRLEAPPTVQQFTLTLSVDGLPLHKSGAMQFWPVLFAIDELPAAIYSGFTKPTSLDQYLRPVVDELNGLMRDGMFIHGQHIAVKVRAIVADTPARAFLKGVVGHTGYWSCQKYTVRGEYNRQANTMVFPFE